ALTKAVAYGRLFSTGGLGNLDAIKNRANFQSEVVAIAPDQVTFSDTINGTYLDSSSANYNTAAYAQCSYPLSGLPIYFMQLINPDFVSQTVSATAVATMAPSASVCAIPVGVCKVSGGTNFGLTPGQWLAAKGTAPYGTGNFGWIDFTPPSNKGNELYDLLKGSGQCELVVGAHVGAQGQKTDLDVAWNSRFGVYKNGGGNPSLNSAPPDFTGYAYSTDSKSWPSGFNAYSGTPTVPGVVNFQTARSSHEPYQEDDPFGTKGGPYSKVANTAELIQYGRDRRLAVAPVVDCAVWNSGGPNAQPAVEGWACVLMLNPMKVGGSPNDANVEFIGLSNVAGSPCASSGAAGTAGPLVPVLAQ
ncbi:MAG: hypothetical protein WA136_05865, partial [Rhodoferax sp.]